MSARVKAKLQAQTVRADSAAWVPRVPTLRAREVSSSVAAHTKRRHAADVAVGHAHRRAVVLECAASRQRRGAT